MAANTATLQVEVVSKGVKEATDRLDSLGSAAARNAGKVETLTGNIEKLMQVQKDSASSSAAYSNMMYAIAQAMGQIATAAGQTARDVKNLNDALGGLANANSSLQKSFQATVSGGGVVNTTLRAMATAASAYIGVNMAKSIVEASDGWQTMAAKLKQTTGSMSEAKAVQSDLFDLAQKMRSPLDDMAKLYNRISAPMEKMGKDSKDTMEQVEYLAASLKLAGATTAEASSVMLQYSQSVNSGKLQGGEFNAVAEASPAILRDIEAYLKSTGDMAQYGGQSLKEMASKGLITFDVLQGAAQMALPRIRAQMAEMPETVDGALARIKNAWFKAMGELGEDTKLGTQLNKALSIIEDNIPKIRDILVGAFNFIVNNFDMIKTGLEAMVAVKLISWAGEALLGVTGLANGLGILAKGIGPIISGIAGATTAVEAFTIAGRALLGPWGLVAAAIGTTAVWAYNKFASEAPKAEKAVTETTQIHTINRLALIQKEIDKLNELNGLRKAEAGAKPVELPKDQNAQLQAMLSAQAQYAKVQKDGTQAEKDAAAVALNVLTAQYQQTASLQQSLQAAKALTAEKERQLRVEATLKDAKSKHLTKAESADAEVEEWKKKLGKDGGTLPADIEKRIRDDYKESKSGEDPYAKLTANAKATTEQLKEEALAQDGLTKSRILYIKMTQGAVPEYNKLNAAQKATVLAMVDTNAKTEEQAKADDEATKARQAAFDERVKFLQQTQATTDQINNQIVATKAQIVALQDGKEASKEITAAEMTRKAAMAEANAEAIRQANMGAGYDADDRAKALMGEAAAWRQLAADQTELGGLQDNAKAIDAVNKALDPSKAFQWGNAMKGAFGQIGGAIDKAAKGFDTYGKSMKTIQKAQAGLNNIKDVKAKAAAEQAIRTQSTAAEVGMYADMAGAAKGFFKEKTFAYKAFDALETGLRVAQMALKFEAFVEEQAYEKALLAAKLTSTTTSTAADTAATGISIGNSTARASASAAAGIAKAFEQLGVWGFVGAAAIIAFLASMGVSTGGGGGSMPSLSEQRQKTQGTGTVLGDDSAKSNSASKALEDIKGNADISLQYTSQMLIALRNIDNGISGMAAAVAATSGLRTSAADELAAGTGSKSSFLGFSSNSKEIQDSGILFGKGQTVGSIGKSGSMSAQGYQDIHEESSSWWGLSSDSSDTENLKKLDESLQRQMGLTVNNFVDGLAAAGTALGKSGDDIKNQLDSFGVNIDRISLKGLSGDDIQKEIEAQFSKMGDDMAKSVLPGFENFQKVGEGYFETVERVASGYEVATNSLQRMNVQVIGLSDVANKQGDVATEVVRQSIAMKEAGSGIADMINGLDGSASDLVTTYQGLLEARDYLKAMNLSDDVTRSMVAGAGGVDALTSSLQNYLKLLPAEKQTQVQTQKVAAEFSRLGVQMPASKQALADLIDGYMAGDAASQKFGAELMNLTGDFNDLHDTLESNVTDAQGKLKDAYDAQSSTITDLISKFKDYAKAMRDFGNSMLTGSSSPLTLAQQYAELQTEYQNNLSQARAGDADAMDKFQDLANKLLEVSKSYNASGDAYTSDFYSVLNDSKYLSQVADSQVSAQQQELDALNKQVGSLIDINDSVLSVADAINALKTAMVAAGYAVDGSHANGLDYVPFDGYKAELHEGERVLTKAENKALMNGSYGSSSSDSSLVAEIQALRSEVAGLRQDQAQQTGAIIGGIYDSNERNADAIVEGTGDAISKSDWKEQTKVELV